MARPRTCAKFLRTSAQTLGFATALAASACFDIRGTHGDEPKADAGGSLSAPVPIEAFPQKQLAFLCAAMTGCCTEVGKVPDESRCAQLGGDARAAGNAMKTWKVVYDAHAAGECFGTLHSALEPGLCLDDSTFAEIDACRRIFTGTVGSGGSCQDDVECIDPPDGHATCEQGACVWATHGTLGSPCRRTCLADGDFTFCVRYGSSNKPPGTASCYRDEGLYCNALNQNDMSTWKCAPVVQLGGACVLKQSCVPGSLCLEGTCSPDKRAGEACEHTVECAGGNRCIAGVCSAPFAEGHPCSGDAECSSYRCHEKQCLAPATWTWADDFCR